jgi:HSP20 family protein
MDRFFNTIVRRLSEGEGSEAESEAYRFFPVDIDEDESRVYVDAELPGFTNDQIEVAVDGDVLTIGAEQQAREPRGRRRVAERSYRRVERSFALPTAVDASNAEATLADGVLRLSLPKTGPEKRQKIEIR